LSTHHIEHVVKDISYLLHLDLAFDATIGEPSTVLVGGSCFFALHSHHLVLELVHVSTELLGLIVELRLLELHHALKVVLSWLEAAVQSLLGHGLFHLG
jgi:hypothetical protein